MELKCPLRGWRPMRRGIFEPRRHGNGSQVRHLGTWTIIHVCWFNDVHSSSYDTDLRINAMQSNGHCIAMVGGASWARERDNNWSGFSSTRDPFAPWCNSGSSLSRSFTIKTKQFLHLCHLIAFPLRQWSRWNNLGIWDSDKGVTSFQVKPPGEGWATPIPGNLVWPHGVGMAQSISL